MAVVTTERLIPVEPKTPEAHAQALAIYADVMRNPLGTQRNEAQFGGMPSNYVVPPADIYVVNHSRTRARKYPFVVVSARSGAEEAMRADKELRARYSADMIYREVEKGRDMNVYRFDVKPAALSLRVPGGRVAVIPPAESDAAKPTPVKVPDGTWDLYLGNYDRMRGFDQNNPEFKADGTPGTPDSRIIGEEKTRLAIIWRQRKNPVFAWTDDGETHEISNPFGYIEFVRVPVRMVSEPINKEYLTSLDLVEA